MHYVTGAAYVADHKIKVKFETGEVKLVDLAPHLDGPIFQPLKDPSYFKTFTVNQDIDTVAWPNSADLSPDFLYEIGISGRSTDYHAS
jgi:hypothetical protein